MLEYNEAEMINTVFGEYLVHKLTKHHLGGEAVTIKRDTPKQYIARVREDMAMIGFRVSPVNYVEETVLHIKQECTGPMYMILLLASALRDDPEYAVRETEKYGALLAAIHDPQPALFVEGNSNIVIVYNDRMAGLNAFVEIINSGVMRACHFSDILWTEDKPYPNIKPDHLLMGCPNCAARHAFPRSVVLISGDDATLRCPTCSQTFVARQLVW